MFPSSLFFSNPSQARLTANLSSKTKGVVKKLAPLQPKIIFYCSPQNVKFNLSNKPKTFHCLKENYVVFQLSQNSYQTATVEIYLKIGKSLARYSRRPSLPLSSFCTWWCTIYSYTHTHTHTLATRKHSAYVRQDSTHQIHAPKYKRPAC